MPQILAIYIYIFVISILIKLYLISQMLDNILQEKIDHASLIQEDTRVMNKNFPEL